MTQPEVTESMANRDLEEIRAQAKSEASRIAEIGQWPDWAKPSAEGSITERIPQSGKTAPGFDAGLACALDLIPREKQALAAALHAHYSAESVRQILREAAVMDPDSETTWWLTGCSACNEDEPIDEERFRAQIRSFAEASATPEGRVAAAKSAYEDMTGPKMFSLEKYGVPYGEHDGCIQAAYIKGYPFGTSWNDEYKMFEISTYEDSVGDFTDFPWKNPDTKDANGKTVLGTSGPIWGSRQRVKCADEEEFLRALEIVKMKFKDQMPSRHKVKDALEGGNRE